MSAQDAIPSGDGYVAIPEELRKRLRAAANWWLTKACGLAFLPDCRDAVIDAVHLLDAINGSQLPAQRGFAAVDRLLVLEAGDASGAFDKQVVAARELLGLYKQEAPR